jgi:transcriptional antiterminator NusG
MMDELNMAEGRPFAEMPPEAKPGAAESPAAPPSATTLPAADCPAMETPPESSPLEQAFLSAEGQPEGQPGEQTQASAPPPTEGSATPPSDVAPAAEAPTAEVPPAEPAPSPPVAEKPAETPPAPAEETKPAEDAKSDKMDWYILKVQSNREESIREGLLRRVAIAGLGHYFGDIIVPTEKVTEFKGGKKKVIKRKLYPGYLVVHMEINDDTWFLVRETPGIGDFTGAAGHPSPMLPHEVSRIVAKQEEKSEKAPKLKIAFREGERVKINEGTFENFEGEVDSIDETNGRVTVMINIFGRSTPVELEYWQIEAL